MKPYVLIIFAIGFFLVEERKCTMKEEQLKEYLGDIYEKEVSALFTKSSLAEFAHQTDLENALREELALNATLEFASFNKKTWHVFFKDLKESDFKDEALRRQIKKLKILGDAILPDDKIKNLTETITKLGTIFSVAKICPYTKQECNLDTEGWSLDPEITNRMRVSHDPAELSYMWSSWHSASGAKMRPFYRTYVSLKNEAAHLNAFPNYGALWRSAFDTPHFTRDIDRLWAQIGPFYRDLHAYARTKLRALYGPALLPPNSTLIPAHLFGNMWAQDWSALYPQLVPYPHAASAPDLGAELVRNNYTIERIFTTADEFYQSMGLLPNAICYDEGRGAMIRKPVGRKVVCHASAWDFGDGENYRVKMCTSVNADDFVTVHHEMGHIQYYLNYAHQPFTFRDGANPGFHEAIGDTIALSVTTPKHLKRIGLGGGGGGEGEGEEALVNALMNSALTKVAFLPFGLLVDKWRWDVFEGVVDEGQWNEHWWYYREKFQMVGAPVERKEGRDFDPGAKFHVAADSQYISYFVAHILQFQFYKSLCIAAGEYDPTNKTGPALASCDFYGSKEAGKIFADGMKLGLRKHWNDVLEIMTGERELNAGPLLEYFAPLWEFLKKENAKSDQ